MISFYTYGWRDARNIACNLCVIVLVKPKCSRSRDKVPISFINEYSKNTYIYYVKICISSNFEKALNGTSRWCNIADDS